MREVYIQFTMPENTKEEKSGNSFKHLIENAVVNILSKIIPKANPDFDDQINNVKKWLIEFDQDNGCPEREIGLDSNGKVIVILPYKNNVGYWVDNILLLQDFINTFQTETITKEAFERSWSGFAI